MAAAARRTGAGTDCGSKGRAGLLPPAAYDHVWADPALFPVLFLFHQAQPGRRGGDCPVVSHDHFLHGFVGRPGDHSAGAQDGHLRPLTGCSHVAGEPADRPDPGGRFLRLCSFGGAFIGRGAVSARHHRRHHPAVGRAAAGQPGFFGLRPGLWLDPRSIGRQHYDAQHPDPLAAALYQWYLYTIERNGSLGASSGVPVAAHLRPGCGQLRSSGCRILEPMARPGAAAGLVGRVPGPGGSPAPPQPGIGLLRSDFVNQVLHQQ